LASSNNFNPATKRIRINSFAPTLATESSPFSRINFTSILEASIPPRALVFTNTPHARLPALDFTVGLNFLDQEASKWREQDIKRFLSYVWEELSSLSSGSSSQRIYFNFAIYA